MTQEIKHTPGPWTVHICENGIERDIKSEDLYVAVCMGMGNKEMEGDEEIETAANARLIAAAPELLKDTEAALAALEEIGEKKLLTLLGDGWGICQLIADMRENIVNAKGGVA